jgi:hypothetical protein
MNSTQIFTHSLWVKFHHLNFEEPIGYPAHTRLITPPIQLSICLSVYLLVHLTGIPNYIDFERRNNIKKSHLYVVPSLQIPIVSLLLTPKNISRCNQKTDTTAHHMSVAEYTRCAWAGGTLFCCLRKVLPAHAQQLYSFLLLSFYSSVRKG